MNLQPPASETQRILVVDDCPQLRALLVARLADPHVEVHAVASGGEALETVRGVPMDLMLLDIDMPGIGGLEVLRRLKADPLTQAVQVILVTGSEDLATKIRGFELGATDYITKPFEPTELRARVRAALRTKYLLDLLSRQALIDGLTGLYNRAYFEDRARSEIAIANRTGNSLGLLMADIDHFKALNDSHGHPFGDEVLRSVARLLKSRARSSDVLCRFGGEEFAALLPNTDAPRGALLAEDLRQALSQSPFLFGRTAVKITASFGVAELAAGQDLNTLVQLADQAMYQSKQAGRNRVTWLTAACPIGMVTPSGKVTPRGLLNLPTPGPRLDVA
jgi:two-component system, cell cycle response regulator